MINGGNPEAGLRLRAGMNQKKVSHGVKDDEGSDSQRLNCIHVFHTISTLREQLSEVTQQWWHQ